MGGAASGLLRLDSESKLRTPAQTGFSCPHPNHGACVHGCGLVRVHLRGQEGSAGADLSLGPGHLSTRTGMSGCGVLVQV